MQIPTVGFERLQIGTGRAFGTFGELLQGVLGDGDLSFMVTLPISLYARATFVPDPFNPVLSVFPPHKTKALRLVHDLLAHFHLACGGVLTLASEIPEGKGMAGSSADLVATVRAIESCLRIAIPTPVVHRFMRRIEPSDGVMHAGIVSFYHQEVRLREFLGSLPTLTIIGGDEGGEVDTVEFNKLPKPFTAEDKQEYQQLLDQISTAVRSGDLRTVGRVATRSAVLNQKLCPKQTLEHFSAVCAELDGLGVVVAHSGPCLGILFSPTHIDYRRQLMMACNRIRQITGNVFVYQTLSFGERPPSPPVAGIADGC